METLQPGLGSEFLIARLMELILVEMLRRETPKADDRSTGLIAGLHDPVIRSALLAMHGDIARAWSVAELARFCVACRGRVLRHASRTCWAWDRLNT